MTVREAAARLQLAIPTIYQMIKFGILPARRIGLRRGKIVLDPADIERYWDESKSDPVTTLAPLRHIKVRRHP